MYDWLVVWNMAFIFPYIWNVIIPIDVHIFQKGWNHQPVLVIGDDDNPLEGSFPVEIWICLGKFHHDLNQRPKPIDDGKGNHLQMALIQVDEWL